MGNLAWIYTGFPTGSYVNEGDFIRACWSSAVDHASITTIRLAVPRVHVNHGPVQPAW